MFVTNHVLAGALLGAPLRRHPVAAFAAGFASHLAMDACPHWGTPLPIDDPGFLRVARRDGVGGLTALAGAVLSAEPGARVATLAAAGGAALPDMDKPALHFFGVNPWPRWFDEFHKRIQRESPDRLPLELAVGTALAVALVVSRYRSVDRRR